VEKSICRRAISLLSSEWKTERVREDENDDSEDDELPCVMGESEGDCFHYTTFISFRCRSVYAAWAVFERRDVYQRRTVYDWFPLRVWGRLYWSHVWISPVWNVPQRRLLRCKLLQPVALTRPVIGTSLRD